MALLHSDSLGGLLLLLDLHILPRGAASLSGWPQRSEGKYSGTSNNGHSN
jgi:hypothetical protein